METTVATRKKAISQQDGLMTERQIKRKVGNGWAIIQNPEYEKGMFQRGELLYYSSDKEKALEELSKCKNGHFAFKFCGKIDPNVVYLL